MAEDTQLEGRQYRPVVYVDLREKSRRLPLHALQVIGPEQGLL